MNPRMARLSVEDDRPRRRSRVPVASRVWLERWSNSCVSWLYVGDSLTRKAEECAAVSVAEFS
jgi:hypothetical protein